MIKKILQNEANFLVFELHDPVSNEKTGNTYIFLIYIFNHKPKHSSQNIENQNR